MGESEMQHGGADMNMRSMPKGSMDMHHSNSNGTHTMQMPNRPMWQSVILSTLHCGAGCTLADIVGTILLVFIPISIAGSVVYGGWGFNYLLALVFGVIFQYYAIKPMSRLSNRVIIAKALKSDFFSLTAWQIGMYLWMYIVMYKLDYNIQNSICSWDFWFVMQQAMLVGFILALPINYILIKMGIKGKM